MDFLSDLSQTLTMNGDLGLILGYLLSALAIIDIVFNFKPAKTSKKVIWGLLSVLGGGFGAGIYFWFGRNRMYPKPSNPVANINPPAQVQPSAQPTTPPPAEINPSQIEPSQVREESSSSRTIGLIGKVFGAVAIAVGAIYLAGIAFIFMLLAACQLQGNSKCL